MNHSLTVMEWGNFFILLGCGCGRVVVYESSDRLFPATLQSHMDAATEIFQNHIPPSGWLTERMR